MAKDNWIKKAFTRLFHTQNKELIMDPRQNKELQEKLDELCRKGGFDYAKYLGEYKGESIYKPSFNIEGGVIYGRPRYLHVKKNGKIRPSRSHSEVSKVMHYFFPDDD